MKQCKCTPCVYQRWWKNNRTREKYGMRLIPKPEPADRDFHAHCSCRRCLNERLRAAHRRNKEYLEVIYELKRKLSSM